MAESSSPSYVTRRICIGWIVSTEYIQRVLPFWRPELLGTELSRIVCGWCSDYYTLYHKAPGSDIEALYEQHKESLDEDTSDQIDILLKSLSDEYERDVFNVEYLLDQTREYLRTELLRRHHEEVGTRLDRGELSEAEAEWLRFTPGEQDKASFIDPFSDDAGSALRAAFTVRKKPLVQYPKALGRFWNEELVRDAFVTLMAREKGGKSWLLMDLALRAAKQGCNTVLFQAGDMTENQMLRRIGIYAARRSDQERYCKDVWLPEIDCARHQRNACDKKQRERSVYTEAVLETKEATLEDLQQAATTFPKHSPCRNCQQARGAVWLRKEPDRSPLDAREIEKEVANYRRNVKGRLRISTHANDTLHVTAMNALLDSWERSEGFIADVVVIDYADLLAPCPDFARLEFRHQQNQVWKRLRRLSQERHCLVVTATQAKATSYTKELLDISDYSEDKRKWAHVTAAFGLNQTPEEKRIGVLRVNSLLSRDSDYATDRPVHVIQRLQIGRPVLGSYL